MNGLTAGAPSIAGVRAYLKSLGWQLEERERGETANFELWEQGDREVLVPLRVDGPDFTRRLWDLVADLSSQQDRDEREVADRIATSGDDVFEMRVQGEWESLALDDAKRLILGARELVVASACSTLQRKAHHGRSRPHDALRMGRLVRMAHTRRGSYVLPFISPATPLANEVDANPQDAYRLIEVDEELFPRRSIVTLNDALQALHRVTVEKGSAPSDQELNEAVIGGVSGDFCQAVASMVMAPGLGEVDLSVRWSMVTPAPRPELSSLSFAREAGALLEETATRLRNQVQRDSSVIFGHVSSLDKDHDVQTGTIKVKAVVDKRLRPISVSLSGDEYHRAVFAHDNGQRIVMSGQLIRPGGRTMSMTDIAFFDLEERLLPPD